MNKPKKYIKILSKTCNSCGKRIMVYLYSNNRYRGGHYFGKVPLCTKSEWAKALKAGTHKAKIDDWEIAVLNKDPKPYDFVEYWECPKCYWRK